MARHSAKEHKDRKKKEFEEFKKLQEFENKTQSRNGECRKRGITTPKGTDLGSLITCEKGSFSNSGSHS